MSSPSSCEEKVQQYHHTKSYESFLEDVQESLQTAKSDTDAHESLPIYIIGFSTGHAGSTTVHYHLKEYCNQNDDNYFNFELKFGKKIDEPYDPQDPCAFTRDVLIPFLDKKRGSKRKFFDLGHFYNDPSYLECLAAFLGPKIGFVRIRRNRHDIAHSFMHTNINYPFLTTCNRKQALEKEAIKNRLRAPSCSYCPFERQSFPPVALDVPNWSWRLLDPFQRFLWMIDDIEMRWYFMKKTFVESNFYEITWSQTKELEDGLRAVDKAFGCNTTWEEAKNKKQHTQHMEGDLRDCTNELVLDIDYRNLVGYSPDVQKILYEDFKQNVGGDKCQESREQLKDVLDEEKSSLSHWNLITKSINE